MTEIIEAIDDFTLSRYGGFKLKQFGFSELMRRTSGSEGGEEFFPVVVENGSRQKVSIDDKYNIITWARWTAPATYENNSDWSFGRSEARQGQIQIRYVIAHKTTLGEDLVMDFVSAFPSKLTIPGYQFAFVDGAITIDPDHEAIYNTEFGNTAYEKHRFTWNIYALNITVQFLLCEQLTP